MHFGENQLSPGLISLSLQPTAHRTPFQRRLVRTSTPCYGGFILAMGSSPGFGSTPCDCGARLGLAFAAAPLSVNLAAQGDSRTHYAKGKRQRPEGRRHSLWAHDFRSLSLP